VREGQEEADQRDKSRFADTQAILVRRKVEIAGLDLIENWDHPDRKHSAAARLSPIAYKRRHASAP